MNHKKHTFLYKNSLSLLVLLLMMLSLAGQFFTGRVEFNNEMEENGGSPVGFLQYLQTGHFIQATFENWESEFLQMGLYVWLTIFLRQQGSSESKSMDEKEEVDREPKPHPDAPWPVKKGGLWLKLYSNSLTIAFFILFIISFVFHALGSLENYNLEQTLKVKPTQTLLEFLIGPRFWFESFQNWQSEFLSVLSIVFLTIYLRQKGSPESKPVDAPNMETGN